MLNTSLEEFFERGLNNTEEKKISTAETKNSSLDDDADKKKSR